MRNKLPAKAALLVLFCGLTTCLSAQPALPESAKPVMIAEAACGKCKFGLPGKACELAIRINGTAYYVDGTGIDDHGDAHAKEGFCNTIRSAKLQGTVVADRFKLSYFTLLAEPEKKG